MNDMTCTICNDADGNQLTTLDEQGLATDTQRSQRLLRAVLSADEPTMQRVLDEIGDCRNCLGRQIMYGYGWAARALIELGGSADDALQFVERAMVEDLAGD